MSRHRNVRSMNYSEEYDGFDDVYGHSVEDDYCISPSEARFLYDRTRHPQMSAFINEENDIAEEDEHNSICDSEEKNLDKSKQSSIDEEKLRLCVDDILDVMGDVVPQRTVEEIVLKYNYDVQKSLDHILNGNETLGNVLLEEPLPQRESKTKNKDENTGPSISLESSTVRGLYSGGGDGPGNAVNKFVIPKLKNVQLAPVEKGMKSLTLIDGDVPNNFSSLQTLMEHHQRQTIKEDDIFGGKTPSNSSPSTLAEFSKSFLNQKNPIVPSLPTDEPKQGFVIPKLQRKPAEQAESKWLIDLSSALKSDPERGDDSSECDLSVTDSSQTKLQPSQDIFLESNFDASKILSADLELWNKKSSPFGKILCRKWKCNYVNLCKRESLSVSRVVRFDFSTPSPDDLILKYVRRK